MCQPNSLSEVSRDLELILERQGIDHSVEIGKPVLLGKEITAVVAEVPEERKHFVIGALEMCGLEYEAEFLRPSNYEGDISGYVRVIGFWPDE